MSRIGKSPVLVPQGVEVKVDGGQVAVKGPKGSLEVPFIADHLEVEVQDSTLQVNRKSE